MKVRITKTPFSFGGEMSTNGGNFTNGLLEIDNGGQHEENPLEGVPMGSDAEGTPNVVEEGETIYNDYVFSNRLKVPDLLKKKYKLGRSKKMTFADASKKLAEESKERPNDPLSSLALEAAMKDLRDSQEEVKARREEAKRQTANATLQSLGMPTLEEMAQQQQMAQQHAYQQGLQDQQAAQQQSAEQAAQDPYAQQAMQEQAMQEQALAQQAQEQTAAQQMQQQMMPQPAPMAEYALGGRVNRYDDATPNGGYVRNNQTGRISWSNTATPQNAGEGVSWLGYDAEARNAFQAQQTQDWLDSLPMKETGLRKAPIWASGIQAFTDAIGLTNKPTFKEADMIQQASDASYKGVRAPTIGTKLTYRPFDRNYLLNPVRAGYAAQQRALTQNAGLNRGLAAASLLAGRNQFLKDLGTVSQQAEEYNWSRRKDVGEFNRQTDMANATNSLTAQQANQNAFANAKARRLQGITAAATQRYKERSDTDEAKGQNRTNFISSLGEYGKENQAWNERLTALRSGAFGPIRANYVADFLGMKAPTFTDPSQTTVQAHGGNLRRKKKKVTKKWL